VDKAPDRIPDRSAIRRIRCRIDKEVVMRILNVDDNAGNLYLMESLLRGYGYEVVSAQNGVEALQKLKEQPFDLIVSDILMPQMDGFQFCREVKRDEALKTVPFVFYTATYTDRKDEDLAMSLGAARFVVKPAEPERFVQIISDAIKEQMEKGFPVVEPKLEEEVYLKAYNQSLINKLEDKLGQLELANRKLQDALEARDREIEERKRAEEERTRLEHHLARIQRIEAIGVLAGGIAHDFNNILSAIIGYTELCRKQMNDLGAPTTYLDQVLKASVRAKELVLQILTFSRQTKQEMKPVMLGLAVKEALTLLKATLPSSIEIRERTGAAGLILSDPTQIHQIIMNLCTNAAHAIGPMGGVIDVAVDREAVDSSPRSRDLALPPGPYLKISITDSGHGMPSEIMKRIFEPYFTTKEVGHGTGLGLSVVHGIVRNNGGAITCESTPGEGTTFMVYLPEFVPEGDACEASGEDMPTGSERILFVDDEEILVDLVKNMMEGLGYRLVGKTSSIEALETFRQDPGDFDLVITDLTMPGMTGDQLARKLLEIREDIPIILYTGYSELISEEKAREMGFRRYMIKPAELKELAAAVREVLDGGQQPAAGRASGAS
jgi:CheY-like chemotaxis protein